MNDVYTHDTGMTFLELYLLIVESFDFSLTRVPLISELSAT